jgi:hypothetical protein
MKLFMAEMKLPKISLQKWQFQLRSVISLKSTAEQTNLLFFLEQAFLLLPQNVEKTAEEFQQQFISTIQSYEKFIVKKYGALIIAIPSLVGVASLSYFLANKLDDPLNQGNVFKDIYHSIANAELPLRIGLSIAAIFMVIIAIFALIWLVRRLGKERANFRNLEKVATEVADLITGEQAEPYEWCLEELVNSQLSSKGITNPSDTQICDHLIILMRRSDFKISGFFLKKKEDGLIEKRNHHILEIFSDSDLSYLLYSRDSESTYPKAEFRRQALLLGMLSPQRRQSFFKNLKNIQIFSPERTEVGDLLVYASQLFAYDFKEEAAILLQSIPSYHDYKKFLDLCRKDIANFEDFFSFAEKCKNLKQEELSEVLKLLPDLEEEGELVEDSKSWTDIGEDAETSGFSPTNISSGPT